MEGFQDSSPSNSNGATWPLDIKDVYYAHTYCVHIILVWFKAIGLSNMSVNDKVHCAQIILVCSNAIGWLNPPVKDKVHFGLPGSLLSRICQYYRVPYITSLQCSCATSGRLRGMSQEQMPWLAKAEQYDAWYEGMNYCVLSHMLKSFRMPR